MAHVTGKRDVALVNSVPVAGSLHERIPKSMNDTEAIPWRQICLRRTRRMPNWKWQLNFWLADASNFAGLERQNAWLFRKYFTNFIPQCTLGGVYVSCIYSHARWSYHRRFRSLLLCPLSVELSYFPSFLDSHSTTPAAKCFQTRKSLFHPGHMNVYEDPYSCSLFSGILLLISYSTENKDWMADTPSDPNARLTILRRDINSFLVHIYPVFVS